MTNAKGLDEEKQELFVEEDIRGAVGDTDIKPDWHPCGKNSDLWRLGVLILLVIGAGIGMGLGFRRHAFTRSQLESLILSVSPNTTFDEDSATDFAVHWVLDDPYCQNFRTTDAYGQVRLLQRFALATFYYSLSKNGSTFGVFDWGWLQSENECDWSDTVMMISCSKNDSIVEALQKKEMDDDFSDDDENKEVFMLGTIPNETGILTNLTSFKFVAAPRDIVYSIPSQLFNLTLLKELQIVKLEDADEVISFDELKALEVLDLSQNALYGTVPSLDSMTKLTYLNLSLNEFDGPLPPFGALTGLTSLDVSATPFFLTNGDGFSSIPSDVNDLTNLELFDVSYCALGKKIPPLDALTQLQYIDLSTLGDPSGTIPDFTNAKKLKHVGLRSTLLSGTIPEDLFSLTELTYLDLSQSFGLKGTIPSLDALSNLQLLNLHSEHLEYSPGNFSGGLTGTIPNLSSLTAMTTLDLSNNFLHGTVPALGEMTMLRRLDLSRNVDLTGPIPSDIANLINAKSLLFLHDYNLSGAIPSSLCAGGNVEILVEEGVQCECCY